MTDAVSSVQFRYGELETEDMDFYRDGVSIFIYDTSGYLLAPRINLGVQADSVLQDQTARLVRVNGTPQMIYDLYAVRDDTPFWVRGVVSMAESDLTYGSIRYLILLGMPLFILIAALGGYGVTRRAFLPVAGIAQAAEQISSGTDLSRRIPEGKRNDELSPPGPDCQRDALPPSGVLRQGAAFYLRCFPRAAHSSGGHPLPVRIRPVAGGRLRREAGGSYLHPAPDPADERHGLPTAAFKQGGKTAPSPPAWLRSI